MNSLSLYSSNFGAGLCAPFLPPSEFRNGRKLTLNEPKTGRKRYQESTESWIQDFLCHNDCLEWHIKPMGITSDPAVTSVLLVSAIVYSYIDWLHHYLKRLWLLVALAWYNTTELRTGTLLFPLIVRQVSHLVCSMLVGLKAGTWRSTIIHQMY